MVSSFQFSNPSLMNLSFGDNSFPLCEQLVIEGGKM